LTAAPVSKLGPTSTVAANALVMPCPLNETVLGLVATFDTILKVAVSAPIVAGVKLKETEQLPPAGTLVQVFVSAKDEALVPVTVILETVNVAVPLFVMVTAREALVVFWS
jgi:hypothetical protein